MLKFGHFPKGEELNKRRPVIFYGWFVLAMSFVIVAVGYSMRYSFSVFYPEILEEFGWSRAETAGAFSLSLLVYGASSPIVGVLVDRFGPRRVLMFGASLLAAGLLAMSQVNTIWLFYFLFGIIVAVGVNSLGFVTHYTYLSNWFVIRRGLAFSVVAAGVSVCYLLVLFYQYLINRLGWQTAYIALAIIAAGIVIPLAIFFMRKAPQEMGLLPDGDEKEETNRARVNRTDILIVNKEWTSTEWTLGKALRTYRFWFMFLMNICLSITVNLVLAHQPIHCQDIGFSAMFAASIFGFVGIAGIIGNLCGIISDRIGREGAYTLATLSAIIGISTLMLASVSQTWLLYLYVIFFGIFMGMSPPVLFSSVADLFAGKNFGSINGFALLGFGIGGAIGPWLGGYIFDVMDSYSLAFIVTVVSVVISCILLWFASPRKVRLVGGKAPKPVNYQHRV